MFSTAVFTIWFLYVWAQNSRFGPLPDCNHVVKYVLFFTSIDATATWLRAFFFDGFVFAAFFLLSGFSTAIISLKTKCSEEQCLDASNGRVNVNGNKSLYKHLFTLPVGCVAPISSLL